MADRDGIDCSSTGGSRPGYGIRVRFCRHSLPSLPTLNPRWIRRVVAAIEEPT